MIELINNVKDERVLNNAIQRFREKGILLPTFSQMENPELIPEAVKARLRKTGLWDIDPVNLFRISWKNEPLEKGGLFGKVNYIELPKALTGIDARIIVLLGKWFPTGAHKVGAAYGCLVPRIVTGGFDPSSQKAVWPSTGNYCRGGAFDSRLMGTEPVAILPEGMSRERFTWLRDIVGSEVIATPGSESNVKEIYDKCDEIRKTRPDCVILNQFDEFGNGAWHYAVTGKAVSQVFGQLRGEKSRLSAWVSATGSAGTIAAGDYLKKIYPSIKTVASEALQCPTLLMNGFGVHRIEGIGDKHIPWIHNVRNTDVVTAIDDEHCMRILRLFNEVAGKELLVTEGVDKELAGSLNMIGISGIGNILAAIKTARYFEMDHDDIIITVATDSAAMYQSRITELAEERGSYSVRQAAADFDACLRGQTTSSMKELNYYDRKAIHNLKYFTWVEQQGKDVDDLNRLWDDREIWEELFNQTERWDELIKEFNERTGVLKELSK